MLDYKILGKRIRHYRKRRGYTQEQLGLNINTSGAYISNIERGVKNIAETLDITVNDMIMPMYDELDQEKIGDLLSRCTPSERTRLESSLYEIMTILKQDD